MSEPEPDADARHVAKLLRMGPTSEETKIPPKKSARPFTGGGRTGAAGGQQAKDPDQRFFDKLMAQRRGRA